MLRTMARMVGIVGAVAGMSIAGTGIAMADTTAYVSGGGGRAHYDSSSNRLTVWDTNCDGAPVAGVWKWFSGGTQRAIIDNICENGDPAARTLDPPANATYIWIQACKVSSSGTLFSCGSWQRTRK